VEAAARAGEEAGWSGRGSAGAVRRRPPSGGAYRVPDEPGADDQRARRSLRARGRFTRNFVVQASAADWALVLLAGLRRRLSAIAASAGPPGRSGR